MQIFVKETTVEYLKLRQMADSARRCNPDARGLDHLAVSVREE